MDAPAATFVRREIWGMAANDPVVTNYARAVDIMKARPASDPTSWAYQAAIHGSEETPVKTLWNECQHKSWFFMPSHRMFLYYFERIVRATVIADGGPADWALPCWNYGLGGRNATLPLPFREAKHADGSENSLFVGARASSINSGGALPPQAITSAKALARPRFVGKAEFGGGTTKPAQFSTFEGQLEATPHDLVHVFVGGEQGLMGNIQTAAQDPIFWLHHANIDRLWTVWATTAGHANPTEVLWLNQAFSFYDHDGKEVSLHAYEILDTGTDLGYIYDTVPAAPHAAVVRTHQAMLAPERKMIGASEEPLELVGAEASVAVQIDPDAAGKTIAANENIYLNVEEIEGDRNPGTVYGIYLDLPENAAPDLEAAYHVGNLSFFGIKRATQPIGDEPPHNPSISVDITHRARELATQNDWAGHTLLVTFRPMSLLAPEVLDDADPVRTPEGTDPPVRLGRISVFYDA